MDNFDRYLIVGMILATGILVLALGQIRTDKLEDRIEVLESALEQ